MTTVTLLSSPAVVISLGLACLLGLALGLLGAAEKSPVGQATPGSRPIPPMDAAAPKTLETATFALG
jgi:hypothetical protein